MAAWRVALVDALPDEEVRDGADFDDGAHIDIIMMGPPMDGLFARLPDLKLVIAPCAGIDDLIDDPALASDTAVCRAQDPNGDKMLDDYALLLTLFHHRNMLDFLAANVTAAWLRPDGLLANGPPRRDDGAQRAELPVARRLRDAGFNVAGWARTPRTEPGMECFYGPDQLAAFLARTNILVNTLAVTPVTTNIINAANLARLPKGATIINLARGKHVVDDNLIAAIDSGHIDSATLDLFRVE